MTRQRNDGHSTEFGLWLRKYGPDSRKQGLDIENLDYVVYNYLTGDLMVLEEKRHGSNLTHAQQDTFNILSQIIANGVTKPVKTKRGIRLINYHGFHVVKFENTSPDDGWTEINGNRVSRDEVVQFLDLGKLRRANEG